MAGSTPKSRVLGFHQSNISNKITNLIQKGALAKVTGANARFVEQSNSTLGVELSKFNDQIYA